MEQLEPEYGRCPEWCAREYKTRVSANCETCPLKEKRRLFKENAQALMSARLGRDAPATDIESLINDVATIVSLNNEVSETGIGEDWTLETFTLINIWRNEKQLSRRVKEYNDKQIDLINI